MALRNNRANQYCNWSMYCTVMMCILLKVLTSSTSATTATTPSSSSPVSDDGIIRESVVIPSLDPEREAQELYEKSLKEFGGIDGRPVRKVCGPWDDRGCQCSGGINQVTLTCRGLGFLQIPNNIPPEVINFSCLHS